MRAADDVIAAAPVVGWDGAAWRMHSRRYRATDPGGALRVSGRYHPGLDLFPEKRAFAALYLATAPEISLGEILRHVDPKLLPALNAFRLTELSVRVGRVADLRDPEAFGLNPEDLLRDADYALTRALGASAFDAGLEGLLVPSATRLGDNLVLFPDRLAPDSMILEVSSRDPRLYVDR